MHKCASAEQQNSPFFFTWGSPQLKPERTLGFCHYQTYVSPVRHPAQLGFVQFPLSNWCHARMPFAPILSKLIIFPILRTKHCHLLPFHNDSDDHLLHQRKLLSTKHSKGYWYKLHTINYKAYTVKSMVEVWIAHFDILGLSVLALHGIHSMKNTVEIWTADPIL